MTVISFKPDSAEANPDDEFRALYAAYRHAKAQWDLANYAPDMFDKDLPEDIDGALSDAHTEALNGMLLAPAPTLGALARKLTVIRDEDIVDGWHCAREIVDVLVRDAERLMDSRRAA